MTLLFELIAVGVLILLNAFFVAAEYGLVTARRTRIVELQHQGNRRARDAMRITSDPSLFISAMQLGVTLTSLGIGALGEQALANAFGSVMATVLAVALAYLILTFLHVVIGELHFRLGRHSAAERAWREALRFTTARADREFLRRRLAVCRPDGGEPARDAGRLNWSR